LSHRKRRRPIPQPVECSGVQKDGKPARKAQGKRRVNACARDSGRKRHPLLKGHEYRYWYYLEKKSRVGRAGGENASQLLFIATRGERDPQIVFVEERREKNTKGIQEENPKPKRRKKTKKRKGREGKGIDCVRKCR